MDEGRGEWYLRRDSYTGKATISEAWRQRRLQNRGDGSGGGLPSQGHRLMHQASYTRTNVFVAARTQTRTGSSYVSFRRVPFRVER